MMNISAVMVTMNREKKALRSLGAILAQKKRPKEVIVVDSSDSATLGKSGRRLFSKSRIRFVYIYKKVSMPEARNIGIRKSDKISDVVFFFDDDIVLYPDYMEKITRFYEDNPEAGGACGYLCDGNKFIIDRWSKFPNVPSMDKPFIIRSMHGSNMSFRRKIFDEFMFHEGLKGYYAEDDEFSARVSKKYKLYLLPYARCVHEHTPTGGARLDPYMDYNTMIFNRYFVYRERKLTLFNTILYIFSESLVMARIILYHKHKARALKGAFRGYSRVFRNIFNEDVTDELNKN